jgi:hypothetical protein
MIKASSWHNLNADKSLNKFERITWLIYNKVNNLLRMVDLDPDLTLTQGFCDFDINKFWTEYGKKLKMSFKMKLKSIIRVNYFNKIKKDIK